MTVRNDLNALAGRGQIHRERAVDVPVPHPGHDVLRGVDVDGAVSLQPFGVAVIREEP